MIVYIVFTSQIVLYFLHSTLVLSFYIHGLGTFYGKMILYQTEMDIIGKWDLFKFETDLAINILSMRNHSDIFHRAQQLYRCVLCKISEMAFYQTPNSFGNQYFKYQLTNHSDISIEYSSHTAVFCAKFQNDWSTDICIMGNPEFTIFQHIINTTILTFP